MNTPYFRAGTGSVIYRATGEVLIFRRHSEDIWQFQQGGLDEGETYEQGLWRELLEETALSPDNFLNTQPYSNWTLYKYPEHFSLPDRYNNCLGQAHKWWFLELDPKTIINLENAVDKEFDEFKWIAFADFINMTEHSFKMPVYEELYQYFSSQILTTLAK